VQKERQPIQLELAFATGKAGEARKLEERRAEDCAATAGNQSPVISGPTIEEVLEQENLRKALGRSDAIKGRHRYQRHDRPATGDHLRQHWSEIRDVLLHFIISRGSASSPRAAFLASAQPLLLLL
jgi:hypothetical protein